MATNFTAHLPSLECPVCFLIPRKEIYQCGNGHSICHICITNVVVCPTCKLSVSGEQGVKVRNLYAETILDGMNFECVWKEHGCEVVIPRGQLSAHESICKFGTLNMCKAFDPSKGCQFHFSITSPNHLCKFQEVLNHMESVHKFKVQWRIPWNSSSAKKCMFNTAQLTLPTGTTARLFTPAFLVVRSTTKDSPSIEIFVKLVKLEREEDDPNHILFSLGFANLTSEVEDASLNAKICVSITTPKDPNRWDDKHRPEIKWTVKPMRVLEFKDYLEMPVEQWPSFSFTIPISHIQKHFADSNGCFQVKYKCLNE